MSSLVAPISHVYDPRTQAEDGQDECAIMQEEEWEVLKSIYPDMCVSNDAGPSGRIMKFEIPVEISPARTVTIVPSQPTSNQLPQQYQPHTHDINPTTSPLTALPPFLLTLVLPPQYPLHVPPRITTLASTHAWFPTSRICDLHALLTDMWRCDSQGVLYSWVEFLHSGDFLNSISLSSSTRKDQNMSSNTITIINQTPSTLLPLLESYNVHAQHATFAETSYSCAICLSAHKGRHCVQLACAHVFCRSCLSDFWGSCIAEGDISRVGCPDPNCVKAGREAGEDDVVRVVQEDEVVRWKWLRGKRALERDPGMIHCPVVFCQVPVPSPELDGEEDGSGWARLRTCPACGYVFCAFCRRTWHGPISECPLRVTESFVLEYLALPEEDVRRLHIEKRWGKANVRRLVEKHEEDKKNREWMEKSTMSCPGCGVHVEKSMGCNHMTCIRCKQHFCYRCGEKLSASEPLKHFSTAGKGCFSKLFDYVPGGDEMEWQAIGFEDL